MKLSSYLFCIGKKIVRMSKNGKGFSFDSIYVSENIFRFIYDELREMKLPSTSYTCHNNIVMLETASLACVNNESLMHCLKKYIAIDMSSLLHQHCIFIISKK